MASLAVIEERHEDHLHTCECLKYRRHIFDSRHACPVLLPRQMHNLLGSCSTFMYRFPSSSWRTVASKQLDLTLLIPGTKPSVWHFSSQFTWLAHHYECPGACSTYAVHCKPTAPQRPAAFTETPVGGGPQAASPDPPYPGAKTPDPGHNHEQHARNRRCWQDGRRASVAARATWAEARCWA